MTNDKTPDDATGDSVILARVHTFLAALLMFLGFGRVPDATVSGMLDELTQWLEIAKAIRRDPQGATARIWWEAWKFTLDEPSRSGVKFAAQIADDAVAEFGKRFLPVAEEVERDTLNTADFDAMRAELDQADRYRGEICDALDGIAGERMFVHPKIIDELRAERDALLKTNAHHASEIESLRAQHHEFVDAIHLAMGVSRDGGYDIVGICRDNARDARHYDEAKLEIATLQQERDKLKALRSDDLLEMASVANALDATRMAIGQKNLPDADVSAAVALVVAERDTAKQEAIEWESKAIAKAVECGTLQSELDELKRQLTSAIVPLPKPERVEPGQRWAFVMTAIGPHDIPGTFYFADEYQKRHGGEDYVADTIDLAAAYYLGTEAK